MQVDLMPVERLVPYARNPRRTVDVAVRRWQQFTGKTATLESTGEPFPG